MPSQPPVTKQIIHGCTWQHIVYIASFPTIHMGKLHVGSEAQFAPSSDR